MPDERDPMAQAIRLALRFEPPSAPKQATRARILSSARVRHSPVRRVALVMAATLVLGVLGASAAYAASADAIPGDTLYGVKLAGERVRLALSFGASSDAELHLAFASARADEMARAIALGRLDALAELEGRFDAHVRAAEAIAALHGELPAHVIDVLTKHEQVLADLIERAPEEALDGLKRARDASSTARERLRARDGQPSEQEQPGRGKGPPSEPPGKSSRHP